MPTFNITPSHITIIDDLGDEYVVPSDNSSYNDAVDACLRADWDELVTILFTPEEAGIEEDDDIPSRVSCDDAIDMVKDMLDSGVLSPESLGLIDKPDVGEHDLSQWSGSPIYFDSEEAAREQADTWPMFWAFHDFGAGETTPLPPKYRYAVVPKLSMAPTAPEGYDWVCLKRS